MIERIFSGEANPIRVCFVYVRTLSLREIGKCNPLIAARRT